MRSYEVEISTAILGTLKELWTWTQIKFLLPEKNERKSIKEYFRRQHLLWKQLLILLERSFSLSICRLNNHKLDIE